MMIICVYEQDFEAKHHSFRESFTMMMSAFLLHRRRGTLAHISCNDLKYKNLFTIIWDNFGEKEEEREKLFAEKLSMMHLRFGFLLLRLCMHHITKVLTVKIVNFNFHHSIFFLAVKYSMTPTNSSPDFVQNFASRVYAWW